MKTKPGLAALLLGMALTPSSVLAQEQEGSVTLFEGGGFTVKAGMDIGLQIVLQNQAFWNLGESVGPEDYNSSPTWGETYAKPFLTFYGTVGSMDIYGKLSAVGVLNIGTDVYAIEDAKKIVLEDAYVGIRNDTVDLSFGSQPYQLGTGMLIADGGGDGFERGAIIFGPRRAWEMTAIARLTTGSTKVEAFYLDPRELESGDTKTELAGIGATQEFAPGRSIGIGGGTVLTSEQLWVQAAPGGVGAPVFIENGRDGMDFLTAWGNWAVNEQFNLAADVAWQRSNVQDMRAWGGRVQLTYSFTDAPWQPRIGYTFQTFSGDDPATPEQERFDPLFYDGSPAAWGSGSNASLVFLNTNVNAHQIWAAATITPRDFVTARYYHVRANELLSPLQFGQGTRLDPAGSPTLISGVVDAHLSDDLYFEYTRVVTDNTFLTGGLGISVPGAGIREQIGGARNVWTGGYLNVVMKF